MHPIYNKFYYKPLPDFLKLKQSNIEGCGIFAKKDINKNIDLGMSHIKVPIIQGFIRTPIGGFLNHSDKFNCELCLELDWDDYKTYNVYTTNKIYKGEELTLNYHSDNLRYSE